MWISGALYIGATATLVVAERLVGYNQWEIAYPGPLALLQTIGLIGLVRTVSLLPTLQGQVMRVAQLTFGLYFVHLLFVQGIVIALNESSAALSVRLTVLWLVTVIGSFASVALWYRTGRLIRIVG